MSKSICLALLMVATNLHAQDYSCTIEKIASVDDGNEQLKTSREKSYLGKNFTVERRTGVMAGILKNNYVTSPKVIDYGSSENSFKVVTTMRREEGAGAGSKIFVLVVNEYFVGPSKPFTFLDNDEIYFGTCTHF